MTETSGIAFAIPKDEMDYFHHTLACERIQNSGLKERVIQRHPEYFEIAGLEECPKCSGLGHTPQQDASNIDSKNWTYLDELVSKSLKEEIRQVIARHNELFHQHGAGVIAAELINVADEQVAGTAVDISVSKVDDGRESFWHIQFDGQYAGIIGLGEDATVDDLPKELQPVIFNQQHQS